MFRFNSNEPITKRSLDAGNNSSGTLNTYHKYKQDAIHKNNSNDTNQNKTVHRINKNLISTGNEIVDSKSLHPNNFNKNISKEIMQNFKTPQRETRKDRDYGSFGRLGFVDNTRGDISFNPHHEYNMSKMPSLNNSMVARSNHITDSHSVDRDYAQRLRNKVNQTQLNYSNL